MIVVLSQKIDTRSGYSDELFKTYHYPGRYRNQLHEGDTFVYYQGNKSIQEQRYYFGTGKIGVIRKADEDNYYAELYDCQKFEKVVPIYLPKGEYKYIEQLSYDTVRKKLNPPWQSSIRPLSEEAYNYILKAGGISDYLTPEEGINLLDDKLKEAIRRYYVGKDRHSITLIRQYATMIEGLNTSGRVAEELSDEYLEIAKKYKS